MQFKEMSDVMNNKLFWDFKYLKKRLYWSNCLTSPNQTSWDL